jgi:hypothetical protein
MVAINQLQKAIDAKQIDTRSLSSEQLGALDDAFKTGELKGYNSIGEYEKLIDLGAMSVAQGKMKRLKSFESATGVGRGDLVLAGTLGFGMLPYMVEREALVSSFVKNGFKDVYGIDNRYVAGSSIYEKRLSKMSEFAKKLKKVPGPVGAPVRLLGNTIGMLDNTVDFFKKIQKFGPSPALAVEAKASLGAIGGAAAGSAAFDMANLGSDFVGATSKDLAELTDSQERQLPFVERMFLNGLRASRDEMLWTGGALGLIGLVRNAKGMVKSSLDLDKAQAKEIAAAAERSGQPINITNLIPTNTPGLKGSWQGFVKKFFTTLGVYPLVGGSLKDFNRTFNANLTQEQFINTMDNLDLPPSVNNSILNFAGVNQIKNEFRNVWKTIDDEYGRFRSHYEQLGNPTFIPTTNIRNETKILLDRLKLQYPEKYDIWDGLEKGAKELTDADDPIVEYIKYLNRVSDPNDYYNKGGYIRLSDMEGLNKMLTRAYSGSAFKVVDNEVIRFKKAFENDINSLGEATNRDILKDKIFKDEYAAKLSSEGVEGAEAFLDTNINVANSALKQLQEANAYYSMVLRPFEKDSVARKLMAVDRKLFADKGIDMTGIESIAPDQVFNKVIKGTLAGDSPIAVQQLKRILGVTDSSYDILKADGTVDRTVKIPISKESQAVWDRYVKRWIFDSFNNATANPIDLDSLPAQKIAAEAQEKGFIRRNFNPLDAEVEKRVRAKSRTDEITNLTQVDARVFTEGGTLANIEEGLVRNHDFGSLDIGEFTKNLGIGNTMGRDKIRLIFGGGAKGEKALKMFDDLIEVKKAIDSVPYTDPAKFIQRSLTLKAGGGQGGMTTTAVTGAVLGIGNTLKLILASKLFGDVISSGKIAENVMEMNKAQRFLLNADADSIFPGKGRRPLTPKVYNDALLTYGRMVNSLFEARGDEFRVNPNKIDFEEVRQKLLSLEPRVPSAPETYDFGTMPKFTRDRIYPEYDVSKKLSPEMRRAGEEYLTGASIMGASHDQFKNIMNSNPLMQAAEAPVNTPPVEPITAQSTPATMPTATQPTENQGEQFAALFPQDTLGQALANRPQQMNQGGLVEDAYKAADEVLSA